MWLVATAVILGSLVGETLEAGAVSAVRLASGAELRLPQASAWPCDRFVSAMLKGFDGEDPEMDPYQDDEISVEWTANGLRSRIVGRTLLGPLPASALPRQWSSSLATHMSASALR
jgi:hypothetical protein